MDLAGLEDIVDGREDNLARHEDNLARHEDTLARHGDTLARHEHRGNEFTSDWDRQLHIANSGLSSSCNIISSC